MQIEFQKYFNLSALSPQQQQIVIGSITDLVMARLTDMIADHLSEAEIAELEQVSASADPDAVINWLNQHIPNLSKGIEEILAEESADIAQKVTALTNYVLEAKNER